MPGRAPQLRNMSMKNNQTLISVLMVAMAFGTAWAIRGKFGHEQGGAWAGGIGAISVVLVAKRTDWYNSVFKIVLAAAVGWGCMKCEYDRRHPQLLTGNGLTLDPGEYHFQYFFSTSRIFHHHRTMQR